MVSTKNKLISDRYAEALVQLAQESKLSFDEISSNLLLIKETLNNSPDLKTFLSSPVTSMEDKKEIFEKVFATELNQYILNFAKVLVDKSRFDIFDEVFESYNKILDKINKIQRIKVTSAVELKQEAKDKLIKKLEDKLKQTVACDWEISPDLFAGLIIKMGDNVIDLSLKHKLEDLSKVITK